MAYRLSSKILHGEIDNRRRGRTTGILHLAGLAEPILLELEGNPWRDLAGHRVFFKNPKPPRETACTLVPRQTGRVGDITASRKVRHPDSPGNPMSPTSTKSAGFENSTAGSEAAPSAVETRSEFRYRFEAAAPQKMVRQRR